MRKSENIKTAKKYENSVKYWLKTLSGTTQLNAHSFLDTSPEDLSAAVKRKC